MSAHFFYGKEISSEKEAEIIEQLLAPFRERNADEALQEEIYQTLSRAKEDGIISIPFKVVLRKDATHTHRDRVEILLDTKV